MLYLLKIILFAFKDNFLKNSTHLSFSVPPFCLKTLKFKKSYFSTRLPLFTETEADQQQDLHQW